jgi:uncharacterized protein
MGGCKGHIPIRTCVVCGTKCSKYELIRLQIDGEDRLVDAGSMSSHGRGAYVCKAVSCLEGLSDRKRLNRLFRTDRMITFSGLTKGNIFEERKSD